MIENDWGTEYHYDVESTVTNQCTGFSQLCYNIETSEKKKLLHLNKKISFASSFRYSC